MNRLIVIGSDTDAGKTTFALLWLATNLGPWRYWKPLETGDSDTDKIARLSPQAVAAPPLLRFEEAVAPTLAARRAGIHVAAAAELAAQAPQYRPLLIETFGGPFSPLNDTEVQVELIRCLSGPTVFVTSSRVGAIGRCLSSLAALRTERLFPAAIVLIGEPDAYAHAEIASRGQTPVFSLEPPAEWTPAGVVQAAQRQRRTLETLLAAVEDCGDSVRRSNTDNRLWDLDAVCVWHPYTALRGGGEPLRVVGAEKEFLELADGRQLIDGVSSWWTILHGHREPRLMRALAAASATLDHVLFAGVTHPPALRAARLLLETMPWKGGRVFFSDNGSTAVEVALKMAYQYWLHREKKGRTLFVGFENGYHGDTFGVMAVGRDPLFFGKFEPLLFEALRSPVSAEQLDELLQQHPGRVAAVVIEPLVQGAGGMRMHSSGELKAIYEVARRHDVLFIADEVMTGCHRTGTMWAFEAAGISPDIVCAAKTLAGGILSLAATVASPEIVAAFDTPDRAKTFFHGHSFTAHPLACAIAAENLQWLRHEPPEAPTRFEAFWKERLVPLQDFRGVREVRIRGTIAAIELNCVGGYLADVGSRMRERFVEQGVLLRSLGNVLYTMPPFCASEVSLARIAEALVDAVVAYGGSTAAPNSK